MNGHFVCDICGAIRPASETVHICEHARKPDALCVKECTHWGRSQEECISDHDGLCKGKDGDLFRDYCDTRCACLYPAKRKLPAPPLPIRAPGHGQVTEEERVERAAAAVNRWLTIHGYFQIAESEVACAGIAHDVLAAAAAVPGPEVGWTTEPPKEPGWYWTKYEADEYKEKPMVRQLMSNELPMPFGKCRCWWPVPISEPPVRVPF